MRTLRELEKLRKALAYSPDVLNVQMYDPDRPTCNSDAAPDTNYPAGPRVVVQEAFNVILFSTLFHPFPSFWGFATTQVFLAVYVSRSLCEISQIEMTTDMKPFKGFYMNE